MALSFGELFNALTGWVGCEVTVQCRVMVDAPERSFIAASYEAYLGGEKLLVTNGAEIARQLLHKLPPYGGGACLYDEEILITGTVLVVPSGFQFTAVKTCTVRRDDTEIVIQFPTRKV
jgi:hypothetical protein